MSGLLSMSLDAIMADKKKAQKPKPKPQQRKPQQAPRGGPVRAQSNRRANRPAPYQQAGARGGGGGGFGGGAMGRADAPGKWQKGNVFGGGRGQGAVTNSRAPQQKALSATKVMVTNLVKDVRVGDILELFQVSFFLS
jgi:hypothetical protein